MVVASKKPRETSDGEVAFGFRRVARDEKSELVRGVFDSVASRYDAMNDVMSVGLHRRWKKALVRRLRARAGERIVDVAGGTGDIAFRILAPFSDRADMPSVSVVDVNEAMLNVGRARAADRGILNEIDWTCGDAESLPLPDRFADAYTVAFGIRNMTSIATALSEAHRVLRPGGRFFCLEFSQVAAPLRRAYDAYSFRLLPVMGRVIARDADSYRYLAESIRTFPDQQTFARMIAEVGFDRVSFTNFSGGIVAIHAAWRT